MNPIRENLLARSAELRERLQRVRADMRRETNPLPKDSDDAAIVLENDEILAALESTAQEELSRIDSALRRFKDDSPPVCEVCGVQIDASRLRVIPHAVRCINCAREV